MQSKKVVEIDRGAYKLLVEVEVDTELSEVGEEVANTIAEAVEENKNEEGKKKKKSGN